jgi:hypothetical protein
LTNQPSGPSRIFVPIERESPAGRQHLHTLTAGAWLPFMQASMGGFITFMVIGICGSVWRMRSPWSWGAVFGSLVWGFAWMALSRHWFSLTSLEQVTGIDLNRDGFIGTPPAAPVQDRTVHVRLSETSKGNLHETRFDLPATFEQLHALADGLMRGNTLSERNWTGAGRPFSINEFRVLRTEMYKRGLIGLSSPKDGRQGYELTRAGMAVMRQVLSPPPGGETD